MSHQMMNPHGHRTFEDAIRCTMARRSEARIWAEIFGPETAYDRGLCISLPEMDTDTRRGVASAQGQPRSSERILRNDLEMRIGG